LQLKQWKDYATSTILSRPNVVFVDIDEENNRISIGVLNAAEIAPVKRLLDDKHIPGLVGALIPIDTSPNPQVSPGTPEDLRNTQRLIGGVDIRTGSFYNCTLSFNAKLVAGNMHGYYVTYSSDHFFCDEHSLHEVGGHSNKHARLSDRVEPAHWLRIPPAPLAEQQRWMAAVPEPLSMCNGGGCAYQVHGSLGRFSNSAHNLRWDLDGHGVHRD
jgi:hypothetical protein